MSKDTKIERDLLKINGNMAPPSGRILKTFLWWEASLCSRPYKLTSVKFRDFFFNLNLASFLNCKALFLPVLMNIRQPVTPVFVFALSQLSRKLTFASPAVSKCFHLLFLNRRLKRVAYRKRFVSNLHALLAETICIENPAESFCQYI